MHSLFHSIDFFIRQMIKVACAFSCGKVAVVLETEANEKINLSVGHIYRILDRLFGRIVAGQEGQFVGEFGINGLVNKPKQSLYSD